MAQGLQVFNENGALVFDVNHRLGRVLGSIDTGTVNGSYTYPWAFSGTLFAAAMFAGHGAPGIAISGSNIAWMFNEIRPGGRPNTATPVNTRIVFGCY